ncbi:GmrSD restriction endonuclease domain-containing protein [Demequina sp. SO4-13]|uniref:GmrSD restriction endonuclease domain-containing protein n=1 Tax=Demequina sp. SO4-13 TaxID=3401027 RepID=UPI003AF83CEF
MSVEMQQPSIADLLKDVGAGRIQLPDFQREYRWDVERIRELLVTVLKGHPMGVYMVLQTGSDQVRFKPKTLTGVVAGGDECRECAERFRGRNIGHIGQPDYLLLDGQQRLTSLFQALGGDGIVHSADDKGKLRHVTYFLDVEAALGQDGNQSDAIVVLPADRVERTNFGRDVVRDCSTLEGQLAAGLMPVTAIYDDSAVSWMLEYLKSAPELAQHRTDLFTSLQSAVFGPMKSYQVPGIELLKDTSRDAVATVFEKVNTGGLALDTFELLTATFAGDPAGASADGSDFRLVDDWKKTKKILDQHPTLGGFQKVFFLQAITLLATRAARIAGIEAGKAKPRSISARREDILRLRLPDYLAWADQVRAALPWVAQFLIEQRIHSDKFVPYATQIVPLTVVRVLLAQDADKYAVKERLQQWYWCGVLGEQYGSTTETKFARDVEQVPDWAMAAVQSRGSRPPETVTVASFAESRLLTLRTRGSAAYKGIYALLMRGGCKDWQYDQDIDHATYNDMNVDIHHVFPRKWCLDNGIEDAERESIVNKTPLSRRTNIMISANSPADYVVTLGVKSGLSSDALDRVFRSHEIDPVHLRAGDFPAFFDARREALVALIERAMGKAVARDLEVTRRDELIFEPEDTDDMDADEGA